MQKPSGAMKIFSFRGINVYLHWTWALVAFFQLKYRYETYTHIGWAAAEYVTLFAIVLLHEFGHALACRQVGGTAETILLWPLGGVAFVQPPERPGAQLWSIVAGPLVNLILIAPTVLAAWLYNGGFGPTRGDFGEYLFMIALINGALLAFNLLPVYPLDGGQILRSILWYFIGPANSLLIASLIGLAASAIGFLITLRLGLVWLGIMAAFALWQSWMGFQRARSWLKWQQISRHAHAACPGCGTFPPKIKAWQCDACGQPLDIIAAGAICPQCAKQFPLIPCPSCSGSWPLTDWLRAATMAR